jgi:PAS domain S-box-containing protein
LSTNEENYTKSESKQTIDKNKQKEEPLHTPFSSMTAMFEALEVIYFTMELTYDENEKPVDGIFREVNSATERLLDKSREQLIGKSRRELFGNVFDELPKIFDAVVKSGKPSHFVGFGDALKKYYDIYAWKVAQNQVSVILKDISESKKAEEDLRSSEKVLSAVTNGSSDAIYVKDRQSHWLFANPALEQIVGKSSIELLGKTDSEIYGYNEASRVIMENDARIMDSGKPETVEECVDYPEGRHSFISVKSPRFDDNGKVIGLVGISHDITDRKKTEEALRDNMTKLHLSLEASKSGTWEWNLKTGENVWSKETWLLYGLKQNGGKASYELWLETIHPDDRELATQAVDEAAKNKTELNVEYRISDRHGKGRWLMSRGQPHKNANGFVDRYLGIVIDITERKKMEQTVSNSLKESQRRESEISALLKASRTVLQNKEFPESARAIFDACKELLGATAGYVALLSDNGKENIVLFLDSGGLSCTVDPSLPMPIRGLRAEAYNLGKVAIENDFAKSKWQKFSPKGHMRLKNVLFAPLKIEQRTVGVIGLANKLGGFTERDAEMAIAFGDLASIALVNSKMLEVLEEKQEQLKIHSENLEMLVEERTKKLSLSSLYARNLIEASLDPLVTISAKGKITDVNKATEVATGRSREELIGSDFSSYFVEPEKAKIGYKRVFKEGVVRDYPLAIKHRNGRIVDVLYNATVYTNDKGEIQGVFAAARDISELKKAEAETKEAEKKLKDSERLAAIGATAGMVGHDIRNPLQAITGDVFLAKSELDGLPDGEAKQAILESLIETEKNVDYINKIVQDLQDYARPLNPNPGEANLKQIMEKLIQKNGIPKNVKVSVEIEDNARKIVADADYLNRILYNLVTNAVQAMPKGGKLTIHVFKEAKDTILAVKDTGVGIPKEIQGKMFTPMFTTKSKGQGFGLPVVKRMTESLGGTVSFKSQEGKGTTFIVRLPLKETKQ